MQVLRKRVVNFEKSDRFASWRSLVSPAIASCPPLVSATPRLARSACNEALGLNDWNESMGHVDPRSMCARCACVCVCVPRRSCECVFTHSTVSTHIQVQVMCKTPTTKQSNKPPRVVERHGRGTQSCLGSMQFVILNLSCLFVWSSQGLLVVCRLCNAGALRVCVCASCMR